MSNIIPIKRITVGGDEVQVFYRPETEQFTATYRGKEVRASVEAELRDQLRLREDADGAPAIPVWRVRFDDGMGLSVTACDLRLSVANGDATLRAEHNTYWRPLAVDTTDLAAGLRDRTPVRVNEGDAFAAYYVVPRLADVDLTTLDTEAFNAPIAKFVAELMVSLAALPVPAASTEPAGD